MTGMARKLALTAIAAIAASSVACSPTVSAQPANPAAPQVTPPSTTILVLLGGGRIYRATAAYEYCDTVQRFARTAIDRIPG